MNSDTENLSKASNKKVKNPIRFFIYGKEASGLFVGKLLPSTSSCKMRSWHYRLHFALTPGARFSQELSLKAKNERKDQTSRALEVGSQNRCLLPDSKCGNASSARSLPSRCVVALILAPEKAN